MALSGLVQALSSVNPCRFPGQKGCHDAWQKGCVACRLRAEIGRGATTGRMNGSFFSQEGNASTTVRRLEIPPIVPGFFTIVVEVLQITAN